MTCIVGLIDKETIYIGGDSAGAGGTSLVIRKDKKVFIKDGKFIIGFTSSFRMGQLLMYDDRFTVREQNKDEDDFHFMINAFIPSVQNLFKEGGYLEIDKNVMSGGVFLVGYNKRLYQVQGNFQLQELINNYDACGCGVDIALGSLYTSENTDLTPEQRIIKALQSASEFSTSVRPPFNIIKL
jgi:ATP-dependent protease HslVU (ClpYQ) peptidase subunit